MMSSLLSHLFAPLRRRALDGAGGGRRWDGAGTIDNLNGSVFQGSATLRKRAAHFVHSNPWAAQARRALVASIVGSGLKPQSNHPNEAARKALAELWSRHELVIDAEGRTDFTGLQAAVVGSMVVGGEGFARARLRRPEDGLEVPFQLQLLAPEQVDMALHRDQPEGARIRAGVEFDRLGRRVAYHVFPTHPGDPLGMTALTARPLPEAFVDHVFLATAPGQVRGISWLAPGLLRLHELDAFEDATLVGQKVKALYAGFITDVNGDGAGFADGQPGSVAEHGLEPGTLRMLQPGQDIKFSDPTKAGDSYGEYVKTQLCAFAASVGLTYEQVSNDLSNVNFSSMRAGAIEHRRFVEQVQKSVLIPQFCQRVWNRFVRLAVVSGALPARDFDRDPRPYLSVTWRRPGWPHINPVDDVKAEREAVEARFRPRSDVIASRGLDPEQVDADIAADAKRAGRSESTEDAMERGAV
ncbi:MAG: phage portal protein [Pseudomonadota bacterium]